MQPARKAKDRSPAKDERPPNVDTYLLAKQSGLFRPGQPFILAFAVPQQKPAKSKGKPK